MKKRISKFEQRKSENNNRPVRSGSSFLAALPDLRFSSRSFGIDFRISAFLLLGVLLEISCAAPAEPQPARPVIPVAVTDLAARQRGNGGLLTFTPPARSQQGERLASPPSMEILRGFAPAGAQSPPSGSLSIVYTLPGPVLDTYLTGDRVEFQDPIKPEEIARHSGERLFYLVRARASKRAASEDSNAASFLVHPAPASVREVRATVLESGVQLSWEPPSTVSGGAPLTTLGGYRIYRAEAEKGAAGAQIQPPPLAGLSPSPNYLDTQIEWGKTYVYTVRSVAQYGAEAVESDESRAVEVTPKDIFPPAPPLDLIAVFVPAAGATPAAVELSWAISPEPDAAGYYVYRKGEGQENPQRVTPALLPTPAFRDTSILPGAVYTYGVTSVDRAGNESQSSKSVSVKIPKVGE